MRPPTPRAGRLTVVKVGGSLLVGAADLRRVAAAISERRREGGSLLVVASALKGVTDLLETAAFQALDRRPRNGHSGEALEDLRRRHLEITRDIAADGPTLGRVQGALAEAEKLVASIRARGELPDATYARLLSCGERLSVILLAAAIRASGHEAQPIAAEQAGLRAGGPPRAGSCDIPASAAGFRRLREDLVDRIVVLTGFYGVDGDGDVVLFGRGGSDDTACAVAAGVDADRLELWKDVPGLMSADPREVRGARVIREISFDEVAQLAAYGSRVVHHGCLEPLRGRSTQVSISSIPEAGSASGTRLVERLRRDAARVVALASSRGHNGSPALVGVVGDGIADDPGIRSRMVSCLAAAGARGDLSARPSGHSGLSCTVHPEDLGPALSSLHESFFARPRDHGHDEPSFLEIPSMIPVTRPAAPASNLVDYWNEARLRFAAAKSSSVRPAPGLVPWRAALEDVLKVGYGVQAQPRFIAGAWQQVRWRTTPSAGALYPFEVIASIVGEGSYLWDIEKGHLVPYDAMPLTPDDLAAAGFVTRSGHRLEALLTFIARPWLCMKKYRLRGYGYCHLDVGHTATNLALYTAALGHDPVLHLRFSRTVVAEHLRLEGLCREPLAVLSFASAGPGSHPQAVGAPALEAHLAPARLELPEEREVQNWESLQGILSFDFALEPPCEPSGAALLPRDAEVSVGVPLPLPDGRPPLSAGGEWRSAILGRRSAKGFRQEPLSVAQIGELLTALRAAGLPADCSLDGSVRLGVRLVARNVDGLAGVFAYASQGHALYRIDTEADDPLPACMQQGLAGNAAALVILHAPLCRLVARHGYSAFAELHFRAAELGQRLHLAATRLGALGMTCIGGFDGEQCAALARLGADEEAVYVILVGVGDESVFKHDRLNVAFSHGHAATLED